MGGIGAPELVIILLILLLLFGGRKLPGLASSIGTSLREFRKASEEESEDGADEETEQDANAGRDISSTSDPDAER
jgi:sec-independent protein translocase protein TatA